MKSSSDLEADIINAFNSLAFNKKALKGKHPNDSFTETERLAQTDWELNEIRELMAQFISVFKSEVGLR